MNSSLEEAVPPSPGEDASSVEALSWMFRCYICMEPLKDARLCVYCSKMSCYACIQRWLGEQRSQFCPHCRAPVTIQEFVNCRWVEEVTEQLATLVAVKSKGGTVLNRKKDVCDSHPEKQVDVYCQTCNRPVCSQCALFGTQHSHHSFRPLETVYQEHLVQVRDEAVKLRRRADELMAHVEELDRNIQGVRSAKEEKIREIRGAVEHMIARLDAQLRTKLYTLMGQKSKLLEEYDQLEALLDLSENAIIKMSMNELINKSTDVVRKCQSALGKPMAAFVSCPVAADFSSELVPQYDSGTFTLRQFSVCQQRADPVYSTPLRVNGLTWRLKVYPDGNGVVRGAYLSVFLELTAGYPEPSKYEYRVELIHQASKDSSRNVVREFSSEFEAGECWGYNRFFRLDLLASEGYLDTQTDTLGLNFYVRAPTYHQKCRDQAWYIRELEHSQQHTRDTGPPEKLYDRHQHSSAASASNNVNTSAVQTICMNVPPSSPQSANTPGTTRRRPLKAKVKASVGGELDESESEESESDSESDASIGDETSARNSLLQPIIPSPIANISNSSESNPTISSLSPNVIGNSGSEYAYSLLGLTPPRPVPSSEPGSEDTSFGLLPFAASSAWIAGLKDENDVEAMSNDLCVDDNPFEAVGLAGGSRFLDDWNHNDNNTRAAVGASSDEYRQKVALINAAFESAINPRVQKRRIGGSNKSRGRYSHQNIQNDVTPATGPSLSTSRNPNQNGRSQVSSSSGQTDSLSLLMADLFYQEFPSELSQLGNNDVEGNDASAAIVRSLIAGYHNEPIVAGGNVDTAGFLRSNTNAVHPLLPLTAANTISNGNNGSLIAVANDDLTEAVAQASNSSGQINDRSNNDVPNSNSETTFGTSAELAVSSNAPSNEK